MYNYNAKKGNTEYKVNCFDRFIKDSSVKIYVRKLIHSLFLQPN